MGASSAREIKNSTWYAVDRLAQLIHIILIRDRVDSPALCRVCVCRALETPDNMTACHKTSTRTDAIHNENDGL